MAQRKAHIVPLFLAFSEGNVLKGCMLASVSPTSGSGKSKLLDQARQPPAPSRAGRIGLAPSAFPAQLQTGREMERDAAQGSAGYKSGPQKSHCRRGPPAGH